MSNNERKENNKIDRSRVSAGNDLHVGNIVNIYLGKYHVFVIASIIVFSFAMYMEISNNYPKDNISTNIPYDSTILINKLPNNIESKLENIPFVKKDRPNKKINTFPLLCISNKQNDPYFNIITPEICRQFKKAGYDVNYIDTERNTGYIQYTFTEFDDSVNIGMRKAMKLWFRVDLFVRYKHQILGTEHYSWESPTFIAYSDKETMSVLSSWLSKTDFQIETPEKVIIKQNNL